MTRFVSPVYHRMHTFLEGGSLEATQKIWKSLAAMFRIIGCTNNDDTAVQEYIRESMIFQKEFLNHPSEGGGLVYLMLFLLAGMGRQM